jgi:hypothetical protein
MNTQIYILDPSREPVPIGVTGEIYVGGAGVARGYLNRPSLTAERFIASPFIAGGRLYKTGDLGRYLADGNIEFLGRSDLQVKIRGFRIELGEIEARLAEHPQVREAVVLAREDQADDKRLVAYYTCAEINETPDVVELREHLLALLPPYMVPAAYVRLEKLPLTPSGKLDRKQLPAPDSSAYVSHIYESPQGPIEEEIAAIWAEVLGIDRIGRHDNFFDLGGHSLLAVRVLARMRRKGLHSDIQALFQAQSLSALAIGTTLAEDPIVIPPNLLLNPCEAITSDHLTLVNLTQQEIERIVSTVIGGVLNVQDIYPLAPLQEGILFHHLVVREGDPYLGWTLMSFSEFTGVEAYLAALNAVIKRHDILRTSIVWEGLRQPMQVVWREAQLEIEHLTLEPGRDTVATRLKERFDPRHFRLDVRKAPLIKVIVAHDPHENEWVMLELSHHLLVDNTALALMQSEIEAHLCKEEWRLPEPLPFRNLVARARFGIAPELHDNFFRSMLKDIHKPTAPFGVLDVMGNGSNIDESSLSLDPLLATRIREGARALHVSAASLFHVAWGRILTGITGLQEVVFGTVLFGRMQGGQEADRGIGLFMNTLPIKLTSTTSHIDQCIQRTHLSLAALQMHEHASLARAQRRSAVPCGQPLFTTILNYRHTGRTSEKTPQNDKWRTGVKYLGSEERTNYPLALFVDDLESGFRLTIQARQPIKSAPICDSLRLTLEQMADELEAITKEVHWRRTPFHPTPPIPIGSPMDASLAQSSLPNRTPYEAPVGKLETTLAKIWRDVLQIGRVGRYDNFFGLGGHSLLALSVHELMLRDGLSCDLPLLLEFPTLCELAAELAIPLAKRLN